MKSRKNRFNWNEGDVQVITDPEKDMAMYKRHVDRIKEQSLREQAYAALADKDISKLKEIFSNATLA